MWSIRRHRAPCCQTFQNAVALQITPYVSTAFYWLSVLSAEEKCRHLEQSRKALIVGVHAIGQ